MHKEKMPKKRTKTSIKKSCDRLWSQCIRIRDPQCVKCGKPTTDAHHIFGRRNMSTRWDLRNGIGLCPYCHCFDKQGFEQSPYSRVNLDVIYKKLGMEYLEELEAKTNTITKYSTSDLLEIEADLKHKLELLKF